MHTLLRICQRAPTFKNQEMYTIRYSYPMLRCNACTTWPQDAASDTATQCKNSLTLHTSHTMTCLDEVALARLNALNILTQIFEKKMIQADLAMTGSLHRAATPVTLASLCSACSTLSKTCQAPPSLSRIFVLSRHQAKYRECGFCGPGFHDP